jgi:hypothetical protein
MNYSAIDIYFAVVDNDAFCLQYIPRIANGQEVECTSFMVLLANINPSLTTVELILRGTSFVTLLASMIYLRDIFTKSWNYFNEREVTYGTFSILMEHLPGKENLSGH